MSATCFPRIVDWFRLHTWAEKVKGGPVSHTFRIQVVVPLAERIWERFLDETGLVIELDSDGRYDSEQIKGALDHLDYEAWGCVPKLFIAINLLNLGLVPRMVYNTQREIDKAVEQMAWSAEEGKKTRAKLAEAKKQLADFDALFTQLESAAKNVEFRGEDPEKDKVYQRFFEACQSKILCIAYAEPDNDKMTPLRRIGQIVSELGFLQNQAHTAWTTRLEDVMQDPAVANLLGR